jgi:hypothetical protein
MCQSSIVHKVHMYCYLKVGLDTLEDKNLFTWMQRWLGESLYSKWCNNAELK